MCYFRTTYRLQVTRQTELGQLLDLTSQPLDGVIDLSRFTLERYISIVKYKTAFYSFYLPVALGKGKRGGHFLHSILLTCWSV